MKRKCFALLLVLLLCTSLAMPVLADAYIPPEEYEPYDILDAHRRNGDCYALNVFLSNFVEAGLTAYTQDSPDSVPMAVVLKHLELNAKIFSGDVEAVTGDDGKPYMEVSGALFERRMKRLFGKKISASRCPGYEDGSILVSAEHFGGPVEVFASVTDCREESSGIYRVLFEAYLVNQDFPNWYKTANYNLPMEKLTLLGQGEALVVYDGGESVDSISSADFTLEAISMEAEGIPNTEPNLPYGVEPTEPPTEAPAETAAPVLTEPATEAPREETTAPAKEGTEPEVQEEASQKTDNASGIPVRTLVLLIMLILAVSILALLVILLVFKKK